MTTWVTVARLDSPTEADLAVMRLEQASVRAIVRDHNVIRMMPVLSGVLGGVRVEVPREQQALATEVLGELAIGQEESNESAARHTRCPQCGGKMQLVGTRNRLRRAFAAILTFLSGAGGVPRPVADGRRCEQCGESVAPQAE